MIASFSVALTLNGHLQENNLVFVNMPGGHYMVGEKPFAVSGYSSEKVIIDLDMIDDVWKIHTSTFVDHYINQDSKEKVSIAEYETQKQQLLSKRKEVQSDFDDDVSYEWETIKDRHAYELFNALFKQVTYPSVARQHVNIVVQGEAPISHPYIHPIRKITGDLTNTLYQYSRGGHVVAITRELFLKNGWRELEQEPPIFGKPKDCDRTFYLRGGALESSKMFSKDVDTYITIAISGLKQYEKAMSARSGTFAELKASHDLTEKDVRACLGSYFNRNKALSELPTETVGKCLNSLVRLSEKIRAVDSMKKTQSEYNEAWKLVNELIKNFREAAAE